MKKKRVNKSQGAEEPATSSSNTALEVKTEYCGSFTQDDEMMLMEIISETLILEINELLQSISVHKSTNVARSEEAACAPSNVKRESLGECEINQLNAKLVSSRKKNKKWN